MNSYDALKEIQRISEDAQTFDTKIKEKIRGALNALESESTSIVTNAMQSLSNIQNDSKMTIHNEVRLYLEPHLESILQKFTESIASKIDILFKASSQEFMKQNMVTDDLINSIKEEEQQLRESLRTMSEDCSAQKNMQKIAENDLKDMTKALSEQVLKYTALLQLQGEVKNGESLRAFKISKEEKKRKSAIERMEILQEQITKDVEALEKILQKFDVGKKASNELVKTINMKKKSKQKFDQEIKQLKTLLETLGTIKTNYQSAYDQYSMHSKDFEALQISLKSSENLLAKSQIKDEFEEIKLTTKISGGKKVVHQI